MNKSQYERSEYSKNPLRNPYASKGWYTVREIAEERGVTTLRIRQMLKQLGLSPIHKLSTLTFYTNEDAQKVISANQKRGRPIGSRDVRPWERKLTPLSEQEKQERGLSDLTNQ